MASWEIFEGLAFSPKHSCMKWEISAPLRPFLEAKADVEELVSLDAHVRFDGPEDELIHREATHGVAQILDG